MRFTLVEALIGREILENGKVATPILSYMLLDNETGRVEEYSRLTAYALVGNFGATNCEAKHRIDDRRARVVFYLKLTDGTKINEYLVPVTNAK